jgi:hypothetical protein
VNFIGGKELDGNRWQDCHCATDFKRAVRARKAVTKARKQHHP